MQMKFSFFNASEFEQRLKCTIHKTGKLGFSEAAIKKLVIGEKRGVMIGKNEEDESDTNLYMVFMDTDDDRCFRLNKAGGYYYVNTKPLFDKLNLDYQNTTIIFDIVETPETEMKVYKLIKREVPKRKQ